MKQIACLYITLILLSPAPLFSAFLPAQTSAPDMQFAIKNVYQNQFSLEESMADLSDIFGVRIELESNNYTNKFNLKLEQATLEQALKEVIRKAGIKSYALVWDQPDKTIRLLTFESGKNGSKPEQKPPISELFKDDKNPLTHEQLYLLAQQNIDLQNKDEQPLTPEELGRLQKQNAEIEAKEQEKRNPLTPEQLQRLQKKNAEIVSKEQENMSPLTSEQLQHLKQQSEKKNFQEPEIIQPLTREQMLLLQELDTEKP